MIKKCILLLVIFGLSPCVHAYIDPGTGSFVLQMFIASILGAGLTIKMYYRNIKEKLKRLFFAKDNLTDQEKKEPN